MQVGLLQQFLPLPGVLGPDQDFQQVVQVSFDAFAQHEAVVPGEFAGVIARPQDQVIGLRDDDQFFIVSRSAMSTHLYSVHMYKFPFFNFRPLRGRGKAVKESRSKSPRRTETDVVVTVRRHIVVTVGRTHVRR